MNENSLYVCPSVCPSGCAYTIYFFIFAPIGSVKISIGSLQKGKGFKTILEHIAAKENILEQF